jgi:predicted outer membrane protein
MENENEIAVARIAQRQASSEEVKGFAQTVIKDHGEFVAKLQRFTSSSQAGDQPRSRPGTQTRTQSDRPETRTDQPVAQPERTRDRQQPDTTRPGKSRTDASATRTRGGRTDFVAIHREIGERCLEAIKTELESKDGKEFDQCYMNLQAMSHTKMVASLEVLQNHVSSDLREVLSEGHATAKQHLAKAKELAKNLDDDSSPRTAKRDQVRNE